jgi:hypothetical protein
VTEIQSAHPNQIETALRDVRRRAPDLELLIVILPLVTGHYGKLVLINVHSSSVFVVTCYILHPFFRTN